LIFCGPKGNGKTLRTERAMAAFVKGWITMSGPSSAKAGMQGNSDSSNGSNCVYDEVRPRPIPCPIPCQPLVFVPTDDRRAHRRRRLESH